jgi:hypothetical protein
VALSTVKADTDIATAISQSHASGSDDQLIPDELSDLTDDSTHRLVTDTQIGDFHAPGSDNQDLSGKQDVLVSGSNIKTINSTSLLGAGDIVISGSGLSHAEVMARVSLSF